MFSKNNKIISIFIMFIALISIVLVSLDKETYAFNEDGNTLDIYYLDVGQADATFIILPNEEVMLIDAGEKSSSEIVQNFINTKGYQKIDYVIGTHPHVDHIGGLENIIKTFQVGTIYIPNAISTSKTYESLLKTISEKNLSVKKAKCDTSILQEEDLEVKIISPCNSNYDSLNNYSVVLKITYKDNTFLFMGDAEELIEKEIKEDVESDVIKVGHHGSDTSSSIDFVNRVNPKYAVISVGSNNKYNHPREEVVLRWESVGAKIYRTDINGVINISSDGYNIKVKTQKGE